MKNDKLKFLGKKLAQLDLTEFYATLETKQQENPELFDYIHATVSDERWENQTIKEARAGFVELIKMGKVPSEDRGFKMPKGFQVLGLGDGLGKLLEEFSRSQAKDSEKDLKEFHAIEKEFKKMSEANKMKMLMKYGKILRVKNLDQAADRFLDRAHNNIEFFNKTAASIKYIMRDDHYKTCNCPKVKYEALVAADSFAEAKEKGIEEIMKGGRDDD